MSECSLKEITLDGVKYVRADSIQDSPKPGKRAVVVIDRGWVVAGDVELYKNELGANRLRITRAVHVQSWSSVGFDGMLRPENRSKVNLKKLDNVVDLPAESEILRACVSDNWGL